MIFVELYLRRQGRYNILHEDFSQCRRCRRRKEAVRERSLGRHYCVPGDNHFRSSQISRMIGDRGGTRQSNRPSSDELQVVAACA